MKQVLASFAVAISLSACGPTGTEPKETAFEISFDGADYQNEDERLAHGERLANILSCVGCHENDLTGGPFAEDLAPGIYASNLTREVPNFTDEQLDQILREGIHPVRGDIWIMPSEAFQFLSDRDAEAIIAFMRSRPPAGEQLPATQMPAEIAAEMRQEGFGPAALLLPISRKNAPVDLGTQYAFGRRLTMITCGKCHGGDLKGSRDFSPDLMIAGAYSREQLLNLLTTGEALGGRDIGLMGFMGAERFSRLTDHERKAIVDYVLANVEARMSE